MIEPLDADVGLVACSTTYRVVKLFPVLDGGGGGGPMALDPELEGVAGGGILEDVPGPPNSSPKLSLILRLFT
jgi:hypothetical protein